MILAAALISATMATVIRVHEPIGAADGLDYRIARSLPHEPLCLEAQTIVVARPTTGRAPLWTDYRRQSSKQNLEGGKGWSFHYKCMTN